MQRLLLVTLLLGALALVAVRGSAESNSDEQGLKTQYQSTQQSYRQVQHSVNLGQSSDVSDLSDFLKAKKKQGQQGNGQGFPSSFGGQQGPYGGQGGQFGGQYGGQQGRPQSSQYGGQQRPQQGGQFGAQFGGQ